MIRLEFFAGSFELFVLAMRAEIDLGHFGEILLLTQLLVFKAVTLFAEPDTEKTMFAADAVAQECRRTAISAVLTPDQTVAAVHVDTVVTKLTAQYVKTVDTTKILLEAVAVVAILAVIGVNNQVAVFCKPGVVNIIGIYVGSFAQQILRRHILRQFFELFEYGPGKIYFTSEFQGIPLIAMPAVPAIDGLFILRRLLGQDALTAKPAFRLIEKAFVTKRQAALLTAVRASRRRWNGAFLSLEHR